MTENIRIVIADDSQQARADVRALVECQNRMKVIADAGNGRDAIALVKKHLPDIILMDIDMPGIDGLQALERIRHDYPQTHVMIVSREIHRASVKEAQRLGARGYVAKRDLEEELILAIETVMSGHSFLSRAVSQSKAKRESGAGSTKGHLAGVPDMQEAKVAQVPEANDGIASGRIRVLVVDDDPYVVRSICQTLTQDRKIHVVGLCENVETAMRLIEEQSLHIVLLDLGFRRHERGGWEVVDRMQREHSHIQVILCTVATERADVSEARRKGIAGYVPKRVLNEEILQAILTVHSGETYFSPSLEKLISNPGRETRRLTEREDEVFRLFVRDLSTRAIADELGIGEDGVPTHKFNMRAKIGHQDGWIGLAREARRDSALLSILTEMERKVFDLYIGGTTQVESIAKTLRISEGETKDFMREIRRKLNCHPDGWKGIAREEGDI